MDALSDKSDKRNKKLQQEADTLKSITKEISSAEDAAKARARIQQRLNNLTNKNLGVNEGLKKSLKIQIQTASKAVAIRQKEFGVVEKVGSIVDGVTEGMISGISKLSSQIQQVPVLGNIIAKPLEAAKSTVSTFGEVAKETFTNSFFIARLQGMSFQKSFASGMSEMKGMARSLGPILVNPFVLAAAAVAALLGAGLIAFYKLEQAARAFRNETGLLNSQTQQTEQNINEVYKSTVGLGASMEDVAQTAAAFTNEFGGIEQPAENTIKSMVVLNKNFGVAIQDSAKVNKIFQNMAGVSEEVAQRQSEIVVELSRQAGVAPRQVMADIAESADEAGGFFRGNTQEMIRQSVAARAMGSSLKEVANVSRQLLDYQSSIESEMEASAILGTNLNFSQARYMAATGDIVGAQQNMVKQLRNRVDLENASVFEREAIAKATGMEYNQLLNLSRIQERFGDLKTEQMAAAQSLLKQGKDLSKLTSDDLAAETKRLANQEEMQGKLESMGNRLGAIGAQLLQAFLPIGEVLVSGLEGAVSIISGIAKMIKVVVYPVIKGIGFLMENAFAPINWAITSMNKLIDFIKKYSDYVAVGATTFGTIVAYQERAKILQAAQIVQEQSLNAVKFIGTQFSKEGYLYKMYEAAQTKLSAGYQVVLNGYQAVANTIKKKGLLSAIAEMAMKAFSSLSAIPFIGPILGAAAAVSAFALGKSYMSKAGDMYSPADGRTQVSTKEGGLFELSPNDDFIAAPGIASPVESKIPETLGQQPTSIPNISMDGVIKELKELKTAFLANKDVYIDNERMTSKISRTQEKMITNQFGLMGT
jgi:hypothetical protein